VHRLPSLFTVERKFGAGTWVCLYLHHLGTRGEVEALFFVGWAYRYMP
jgi:hypothetical protein